jgi:cell pole-organizing protein PopZ
MEDILASIKKVIAEEKELRSAAQAEELEVEEDVLELVEPLEGTEPLAPLTDLGPPLLDEDVAEESRRSFEELTTVAATVPQQPPVNPLEEMVREMLKPILKEWVDEHMQQIVNEHVKREISRITGRQL